MSVPAAFILRSYGGGAEPAQLVQPMGTNDTSFAITTTVGWTEADGSPLGTVGPFTVIIDRFTDTVEKITCSSVNLVTGLVTVDMTGGSGRGADGTTPQAHVPNGSPSGVQTCMTSVEAAEFNKTVAYMLGTAGGTQAGGDLLSWNGTSSAPAWIPAALAAGGILKSVIWNPASQVGYTVGGTFTALDSSNLVVTFTVPPSGRVLVTFEALANVGANAVYQVGLIASGSQVGPAAIVSEPSVVTSVRFRTAIPVTGLTPNASLTYEIGAGSFNGVATNIYAGGNGVAGNISNNAGPAIITVEAA